MVILGVLSRHETFNGPFADEKYLCIVMPLYNHENKGGKRNWVALLGLYLYVDARLSAVFFLLILLHDYYPLPQ